ncbi:MAG: hypothetical protein O7B99_11280, partial [Planctomycetota bacterium]|nr:hypothetical protein [Planctomycetota bacterium]
VDESELGVSKAEVRDRILQTRLRLAIARQSFLDAPGWRVEVLAASGRPLWAHGFDPINVDLVADGEVLHGRWVVLGNDEGTVKVLDRPALTLAAGKHPLFEGVSKLVVTGIDEEPTVSSDGGSVELKAEGLVARFAGAKIELSERKIVLRLD